MRVPFLDLKAQYREINREITTALSEVIESASFAGGKFVSRFEEEFAAYCQSRFAIGCGSGTDALLLSLKAAGIGPGDEVITVPNTFIATVEAICLCGATPVFVDVKESDYTINTKQLEAAVTGRTRAVIPVHLYGQMADMDPIMALAEKYGILIIEDACQAHGAEYKNRKAGSIGHISCFSFYPGKNLGAYGEAGAVVTNNKDVYEQIKSLRDHGQNRKYYHDKIGWNSRMDGIQGAVLSVKLKHLDEWNRKRSAAADFYTEALKPLNSVVSPFCQPFNKHIYHIYPVLVENRNQVLEELKTENVFCGIHYPVPVHLQKGYSDYRNELTPFPVSENCALRELSLPIYPELTEEQQSKVIDSLNKIL